MKKLLFASLLTVAVVFAQATGGSTGKPSETPKTEAGKKHHTKKGGKKAEKGKKGSSGTTTTPPRSKNRSERRDKVAGAGRLEPPFPV